MLPLCEGREIAARIGSKTHETRLTIYGALFPSCSVPYSIYHNGFKTRFIYNHRQHTSRRTDYIAAGWYYSHVHPHYNIEDFFDSEVTMIYCVIYIHGLLHSEGCTPLEREGERERERERGQGGREGVGERREKERAV